MGNPRSLHERAERRVGTILKDKWHLDAMLGVGGTAAVYAATHRNGKRAAIKMLHSELAANDELVSRFMREGYAANKLDHPGAVSVLDDDRADDGTVYLVMELLDGYSLERHTRRGAETLPLDQALRVGDELLDVLAVAHTKGVIHRDIKPANLFLTRDGRLKVLDFGIARLTQALASDVSATQTGTTIGTPAFMPPEQARGRWNIVDARTDLWAAGATLFSLLSGQRPRRAETVNEELLLAMTQPVPSLAAVAPQMPADLVAVVDKALAFEMDQRWPDARSMQLALRRVRDALRPSFETPTMMAAPQPDTAPVVHGGARAALPIEPIDAALTTSRPMVTTAGSSQASQVTRPRRGLGVVVAIVAGVAALGVGVVAAYAMRDHTHAASTSPVRGDPPPQVAPLAPSPPPTTALAAPPRTAETTAATTALSAPPTTHVGTPQRPKPASSSKTAKPAATAAGTENDNPFDQRF